MKHFSLFIVSTFCLSLGSLHAEDAKQTAKSSSGHKKEIAKMSEAFGHLIGKNLESMGVQLDIQAVVKGLKDASAGKTSPMTEMECIQAITAAQESAFAENASKNLTLAEEFLAKNSKNAGIVQCDEGKVQYKIEKDGTGEELKSGDSPLIQYVGKFLDGSVFGSSKEAEPLPLDEVIPGLKAGLLGMKEGEKRTIFIHPDLAYGTKGALPPNSLLTFEIEMIKAQAPLVQADIPTTQQATTEIALPDQPLENVR